MLASGAFEPRRAISTRGPAQVFEAVERATGRRVALKLCTFESSDRVRLSREVHALRRLRHPGVARLVSHGVDGDVAWIAMEYVDGETLRTRMARGWSPGRSEPGWMPMFRQLCEALAHVHENGIAHGDLKPENVVIAASGVPVLVDFGFAARLADPVGRVTLRDGGGTAGTPAYMAPERLAGHEPDVRTDLWALGAILRELATGAVTPARGEGDPGMADPASLRAVLPRLLAASPRDRFGHALDVLAALDAAAPGAASTPVALFPPGFRGRDALLDWLVEAVTAARAGRGSLVCITGPSGIGKSRVLAEALRIAAPRMRVIAGGASPLGGQRTGATQTGSGPSSVLLDAIAETHGADHPLLQTQAGGDGARDRVVREILHELGALAAERPLAILLDDLQWADELTLALLRAIPEGWASARPLLWICTARDASTFDAWRDRQDVVSIALDALAPDATAELLGDALALETIAPGLADRLHAAAQGNPLRVLESVRLGLDEGWLRRVAPGRLVPSDGAVPGVLPIPSTLDALLQRRLRDVQGRERALLEAGAVLGRSFTEPIACATAGVASDEGIEALAELLAREVFAGDGATAPLRFASDALAERIYADIAPDARRALHARAAAALAASGDTRSGQAAVLAHHWSMAGDVPRERHARDAAADEALARAAFEEARAHLSRAFALDDHPDARACRSGVATRARWHVERARCAHALADPEAMEGEARAALAVLGVALPERERHFVPLVARRLVARLAPIRALRDAERAERARLAARAADVLVHHFYYRDDLLKMIGAALLATRSAERAGDVALAARSWMVLASVCGLLRLHAAAERHFARGQAAALRDGDRSEQAYCLATRAVYHANFGDFASAREAVRLAEERIAGVDDPFQREIVVTMRGHVAHFMGRHAEARAAFEEVLASALGRGNAQREAWGLFSIARSDLAEGRNEAARSGLEAACAVLARTPELQSEVICFGLLACARMRCGDADGALEAARDAAERIARSRPSGFPSVAGYAALAETWSALAARDAAPEVERARARHRVEFRRFVRLFPMARPAYEQALARDLSARGAQRRARRRLRRAAARARAFGMVLPEVP